MAYLNHCEFIGYATSEPRVKQTKAVMVARFSLNVIRNVSEEGGVTKQVEVVPVLAFASQAMAAKKLIGNGTCVYVSGRIRSRTEDGGGFELVASNVQPLSNFVPRREEDAETAT